MGSTYPYLMQNDFPSYLPALKTKSFCIFENLYFYSGNLLEFLVRMAMHSPAVQGPWDLGNLTWDTYIADLKCRLKSSSSQHDVVLNVNGSLFYAHTQILTLWSPVLEKLLVGNVDDQIYIDCPMPEALLDLLVMIYSQCEIENYEGVDAYNLARVALQFDVKCVMNDCMQSISSDISKENILQKLQIAMDLNWNGMKYFVAQALAACDSSILNEDVLNELPDDCTDFLLCQLYDQASKLEKSKQDEDGSTTTYDEWFVSYQLVYGSLAERNTFIVDFTRGSFRAILNNEAYVRQLIGNLTQLEEGQLASVLLNSQQEGFQQLLQQLTPAHRSIDSTSEADIISLVKYTAIYRVPSLALRCLAKLDHESVLVSIQIASTFGLSQETNRTRLLYVLRLENPMDWLNDQKEIIMMLDDRSKAIVLECILNTNK